MSRDALCDNTGVTQKSEFLQRHGLPNSRMSVLLGARRQLNVPACSVPACRALPAE